MIGRLGAMQASAGQLTLKATQLAATRSLIQVPGVLLPRRLPY